MRSKRGGCWRERPPPCMLRTFPVRSRAYTAQAPSPPCRVVASAFATLEVEPNYSVRLSASREMGFSECQPIVVRLGGQSVESRLTDHVGRRRPAPTRDV